MNTDKKCCDMCDNPANLWYIPCGFCLCHTSTTERDETGVDAYKVPQNIECCPEQAKPEECMCKEPRIESNMTVAHCARCLRPIATPTNGSAFGDKGGAG